MAERYGQGIVFKGWDGGEYGNLDPQTAGQSDKQMWTGSNMMRYQDGTLGPRAGIKSIGNVTGLPAMGALSGVGAIYNPAATMPAFWFCKGTAVYKVTIPTLVCSAAYTGALPALTHPLRPSAYGIGTYVNTVSNGVYGLDHVANTVTNITALPAGEVTGYYMARFIANGGSQQSRMYFSGSFPGWTGWGALDYYDMPAAIPISWTGPFRDGLLIANSGGEWVYMTGVLGATAAFRRVSHAGAPATWARAAGVDNNKVYYIGYGRDWPSVFNGALHTDFQNLTWLGTDPGADTATDLKIGTYPMSWVSPDAVMMISNSAKGKGMIYSEDVWSYHTWGVSLDAHAVPFTQTGISLSSAAAYMLLVDGPGGKFYTFDSQLNRPGFTSDTLSQPGDNSTTPLTATVTLPEWWDDQGHEVRVNQVIVDYNAWDCGAAAGDAGLTMTISSKRRWGTFGGATSTAQSASTVRTSLTTTPTQGRYVFNVGDQGYGGGFQIALTAIKNLAIRSVTAVLSPETRRP